MMPSFKVLINYRNPSVVDPDKFYTLFIRTTLRRRSEFLNMNMQIQARHWQGKERQWIKSSHHSAIALNALIQTKITEIEKHLIDQVTFQNPISLEMIRDYFYRRDKASFNLYAEQHLASIPDQAPATISTNGTAIKFLNEYAPHVTFNMLTPKFLKGFARFLVEEKEHAGRTVWKYFGRIVHPCRQAAKDGFIARDPFELFSLNDIGIKNVNTTDRFFLDEKQIEKLKNLKINKRDVGLIEARKRWLFCFYAGFYYNDLQILKWSAIKKCDDGFYIDTGRFKNSNRYVSPIYKFPNAIKILNEQRKGKGMKYCTNITDAELVFPGEMPERVYLAHLATLAEMCGFEMLWGKTARHSYGQFWVAKGLKPQFLQKMLGHSRLESTQQYYDVTINEVNAFVSKFNVSKFDI